MFVSRNELSVTNKINNHKTYNEFTAVVPKTNSPYFNVIKIDFTILICILSNYISNNDKVPIHFVEDLDIGLLLIGSDSYQHVYVSMGGKFNETPQFLHILEM
jgi:hypothetical protein